MRHNALRGNTGVVGAPALGDVVPAVASRPRAESQLAQTARRLKRSKTALVGLGIVTTLVLVAIFADVLAPYSPILNSPTETFQSPNAKHLLGTDQFGRDMLSRIIYGSRISLAVGLSSVLLAIFVGVPLGVIAGFYGGKLDTVIMRAMDLILAFPVFLLAIVIMIMFTPTAGIVGAMKVIMAIGIVRIPIYARLVRGSVLSIKEKEYIEACRALGQRDPKILWRHVLPNCMAPIIVTGTLSIATAIIVEASLSFLGLGTQPPTPSWGWDLKANVAWIQLNPWLALCPGLAIFITVLGFNLFGDGLRDALDPRLK
ncbi:MAG: glutathione ABC transporter permease GsiD [Candidatus Tectimicrobiota bacterium]|nr:MAG: glutathione ABC transporter permease GsiD [Candidatus Tectomicrobia bacterium]